MNRIDVQVIPCPHCAWSFAGTLSRDDARALRALGEHVAGKHNLHPSEAELRSLAHVTPGGPAGRLGGR